MSRRVLRLWIYTLSQNNLTPFWRRCEALQNVKHIPYIFRIFIASHLASGVIFFLRQRVIIYDDFVICVSDL